MKPIRSRSHLAFIRTLPCSIANKRGHVCGGVTEPMHWRGSKEGGIGLKPGDDKTLPGCTIAHREQHTIGERAFEEKYGISMGDIAAVLWRISPASIPDAKPKAKRKRHWPKRELQSAGFDKSRRQKFDRSVVARTGRAQMA